MPESQLFLPIRCMVPATSHSGDTLCLATWVPEVLTPSSQAKGPSVTFRGWVPVSCIELCPAQRPREIQCSISGEHPISLIGHRAKVSSTRVWGSNLANHEDIRGLNLCLGQHSSTIHWEVSRTATWILDENDKRARCSHSSPALQR